MKVLSSLFLCFISFSAITAQQQVSIADSNNATTFKLFQELRKEQSGNLVYSPFSISTALAMTYMGAAGSTEKQMCSTLHFDSVHNNFGESYKAYLHNIAADTGKNLRLKVANAIWIAKDCNVEHDFTEAVKNDYHSALESADFAGQTELVRQKINTWVERKTNDKIENLIQPGILSVSTRLVLVNAIYFNGKWSIPFPKDSTQVEDFHISTKVDSKVAFMHNTAHYGYYEDVSVQALQIPYAGDKMSMIIILPKATNGIAGLQQQINYKYYKNLVSSMQHKNVVLALPKFKFSGAFELSKALSVMGMPDAFTSSANFAGMTKEKLAIAAVIHKAYVDVNEVGTVAAAATAVTMKAMAVAPSPTIRFTADHPFIFIIKDNATGAILFIGKVINPAGN